MTLYSHCFCGAMTLSSSDNVTLSDLYCWTPECREQRELDNMTAADFLSTMDQGIPVRVVKRRPLRFYAHDVRRLLGGWESHVRRDFGLDIRWGGEWTL